MDIRTGKCDRDAVSSGSIWEIRLRLRKEQKCVVVSPATQSQNNVLPSFFSTRQLYKGRERCQNNDSGEKKNRKWRDAKPFFLDRQVPSNEAIRVGNYGQKHDHRLPGNSKERKGGELCGIVGKFSRTYGTSRSVTIFGKRKSL